MECPKIKAQKRELVGTRACKQLRKQGKIPGVIYGNKKETLLVEFSEVDLIKLLKEHHPKALEVDVAGTSFSVSIQELQMNAIAEKVLHLDMYQAG